MKACHCVQPIIVEQHVLRSAHIGRGVEQCARACAVRSKHDPIAACQPVARPIRAHCSCGHAPPRCPVGQRCGGVHLPPPAHARHHAGAASGGVLAGAHGAAQAGQREEAPIGGARQRARKANKGKGAGKVANAGGVEGAGPVQARGLHGQPPRLPGAQLPPRHCVHLHDGHWARGSGRRQGIDLCSAMHHVCNGAWGKGHGASPGGAAAAAHVHGGRSSPPIIVPGCAAPQGRNVQVAHA